MADTLTGLLNHSVGAPKQAAGSGGSHAPHEVVAAAQNFESVFLSQFLSTMTGGLQGGAFGGDENALTGMIKDEYAKMISKSGGIGVADQVLREMLKMQEVG